MFHTQARFESVGFWNQKIIYVLISVTRVSGRGRLVMKDGKLVGSSLTVPNPWFVHRFGLNNLIRRSMGQ